MNFVLLFGVDSDLFKTCFGKDDDEWSCKIESLTEDCTSSELQGMLSRPDLLSVVVQDLDSPHWDAVVSYHQAGGFVVYFGIYGELDAPSALSGVFGLNWRYSAYTKESYELTPVGIQCLGDVITEQQYTKSNLVSAPEEDRIMIGKVCTLEVYLRECVGEIDEDLDSDDEREIEEARTHYPRHCEEMRNKSPLVMHTASHGGKIAYLGFVNGDGNIPKIVRALVTGSQTM
jgi:predicted NUDIX family NTP pyrophosphohydrolase